MLLNKDIFLSSQGFIFRYYVGKPGEIGKFFLRPRNIPSTVCLPLSVIYLRVAYDVKMEAYTCKLKCMDCAEL